MAQGIPVRLADVRSLTLIDQRQEEHGHIAGRKIGNDPITTRLASALAAEADLAGASRAGNDVTCHRIGRNRGDDLGKLIIIQAGPLGIRQKK